MKLDSYANYTWQLWGYDIWMCSGVTQRVWPWQMLDMLLECKCHTFMRDNCVHYVCVTKCEMSVLRVPGVCMALECKCVTMDVPMTCRSDMLKMKIKRESMKCYVIENPTYSSTSSSPSSMMSAGPLPRCVGRGRRLDLAKRDWCRDLYSNFPLIGSGGGDWQICLQYPRAKEGSEGLGGE